MRGEEEEGKNTSKESGTTPKTGAIQILFVKPYTEVLTQLVQKLMGVPYYQIVECAHPAEALKLGQSLENVVYICNVQNTKELTSILPLVRGVAIKLRKGTSKFILTSALSDGMRPPLLDAGVNEILPQNTPMKSIQFKLEKLVKQFTKITDEKVGAKQGNGPAKAIVYGRKLDSKPTSEKLNAVQSSPKNANDAIEKKIAEFKIQAQAQLKVSVEKQKKQALKIIADRKAQPKCVWQNANPITNEIFLFNGSTPRRIGGHWVAKLIGPSPADGKWVALKSNSKESQAWQWLFNEQGKTAFSMSEGYWIFSGQEPRLQDDQWMFVNKNPELSFQLEDASKILERKYSRISITGNDLTVAKDPSQSEKLHTTIEQSWRRYHRQDEKKKKEEAKKVGDEGVEIKSEIKKKPANDYQEVKDSHVSWVDPLKLLSDFWLVETLKPRKAARNWSISLMGPPPKIGKWEEILHEGAIAWKWVATDDEVEETFIHEPGTWVFSGDTIPTFQDSYWMFFGASPKLSFISFEDQSSLGVKFRAPSESEMVVARDSDAALAVADQIFESLGKKYKAQASQDLLLTKNGQEKVEEEEDYWYKEKQAKGISGTINNDTKKSRELEMENKKKALKELYARQQAATAAEFEGRAGSKAAREIELKEKKEAHETQEKENQARKAKERAEKQESDNSFQGKIEKEKQARKAKELTEKEEGNNSPQGKIEKEKQARKAKELAEKEKGDSSLQGKIAKEKQARKAKELAEKEEGDSSLQGKIAKEKQARKDKELAEKEKGDSSLQGKIEKEKQARKAKELAEKEEGDSSLQGKIEKEKQARKAKELAEKEEGDNALQGKVEKEKTPKAAEPAVAESSVDRVKIPFAVGSPGSPSIAPLCLAFLASELICRPNMTPAEIAKRYCTYVSAALGGGRVELWTTEGTHHGLAHSPGPAEYSLHESDKGVISAKTERGSIRALAEEGARVFLEGAALVARGIFLSLQVANPAVAPAPVAAQTAA